MDPLTEHPRFLAQRIAALPRVLSAKCHERAHAPQQKCRDEEPPGNVWRLIALLLEQNDEWAVQRSRYISLESIAPLRDDPIIKPPAMAAA
jgi:hypothetical protein